MSFFAILMALLIEQARPLAHGNWVHAAVRTWLRWVVRVCDTGQRQHGWLVWSIAVLLPTALSLLLYWAAVWLVGWPLAMVLNVFLLYACLGFRQFSHHFTEVRDALQAGDEDVAREHLSRWQHLELQDLPKDELIRQVLESSVLAAHRHVFGVLSWFSILAAFGLGPAGAVFYRLSEFVQRYWPHLAQSLRQPVSDAACRAASQSWSYVDWLPARITAMCFAVVGSFEEAIDSWRQYDADPGSSNDGVIIAATSGAVNVRLGRVAQGGPSMPNPELGHLRSVVGLVWRTVVLWMVLLALLTLARLLG
jgi:adenosylcobinamide-phosphate synthase